MNTKNGTPIRILIVEDDTFNRKMIEYIMKSEGYEVDEVDNPQGALQLIQRRMPDLILLDITFGVKKPDGFDLYANIRKINTEVPIIFVTSRTELDDKLRGLDMGADDYITKPYAPAEVVARVRRVLHRVYHTYSSQQPGRSFQFPGIELDISELSVSIPQRKPILLTPTEMKLLMHLMSHAEQMVAREDILHAVWGDNYPGESNIVDSYIRKLRRKIESDSSNPFFIRTVRGIGYKFSTKS